MVARQDQTTDPQLTAALLQARRGTAFFARKLNELSDAELDEESLLPGWTRRHIAAHVGYNARAIARLIEWAATGVETPMYPSPGARNDEISFGATLSPIALRNLFDHSAVHLSVEWRDLPAQAWEREVRTAQGRLVPASETIWMRSREVWVHAVDLNNGAAFSDIPQNVLTRLLDDITSAWASRGTDEGLVVQVGPPVIAAPVPPVHQSSLGTPAEAPITVTGSLAGLVRWATGRGIVEVAASKGGVALAKTPAAPRWI
jgi:maleylpyruvate isomerase